MAAECGALVRSLGQRDRSVAPSGPGENLRPPSPTSHKSGRGAVKIHVSSSGSSSSSNGGAGRVGRRAGTESGPKRIGRGQECEK